MYKQTEQFDVHKIILDNLISGEAVLYQLKSCGSPKAFYEFQLYITNYKICIIRNANQKNERIYNINLNALQCISYRNRYYTSKNKDSGEIELISEKIKQAGNSDTGEKKHSYFFYIANNLQYVIKIIESILWYKTNVIDRLNKLRNEESIQIPNEFNKLFKMDRVFLLQKKYLEGIEFNQNLYLTYTSLNKIVIKPSFNSYTQIKSKYHYNSLKILELLYLLSLFWKFKNKSLISEEGLSELQKKIKSQEGLFRNKEILETQFITKKCYNCGAELRRDFEYCVNCGVKLRIFLKEEKKTIMLQKNLLKLEKKRYFDGTLNDSNQSELSKKLYSHYESYLNKDEKILLYYKEKIFNKRLLLCLSLILIDLVALLFLIRFIFFNPFISEDNQFLMSFFLFSFSCLFFVLIFSLFFTFTFNNCLFTSQKIIFKKLRKIGTTQYDNIALITHKDNSNMGEKLYLAMVKLLSGSSKFIEFVLNQPIANNNFKNKISITLEILPKELNLYDKIIEIRNQFKN